ncbi:arsenosugar biosynthesis radical SAM (seleno)protein ArsS [Rhodohalobacter sulfatireducens]|uniref:Arsenosugar biosynthesis radical SAM protein ArsS n=1 Tax=Rhodohalobacter sulfatireducens TaxID=2911366 RepID=A0ABS9KCS3_9BACT|nr:arsenosugar biosynthesis radical SAM (seleno)protein ArsS [Rhodohalobacter sulfatireducens]MCG2588643.1 arsenosugar biosynthesis radical SAM protein ArsS [Rhodohalobacter sulfatireducens]
MKSLIAQSHSLADPEVQLDIINNQTEKVKRLEKFESKMDEIGLFPLKPTGIEIFQINVGYMCNMTCKHCHVDAGPDRQEIMTKETLEYCLDALEHSDIETVDLTGGAPEMNPHFRWFVDEVAKLRKDIIVRSNLTILDTRKFEDLPQFMADHGVEITCSLPFYNRRRTDAQRGEGTYDKSMKVLKILNEIGYGKEESGLELNLVYNPVGAFLPGDQESLKQQYKDRLWKDHGIEFNDLFTITNLPISRYLNFLVTSGNLDEYMEKLVTSFNPAAAEGVMCRNTISIGWDGTLYDCDFNQMLKMETENGSPQHIKDWDLDALNDREIITNQHCYGCTAGAGSSCGGATT